MVPLTVACTGRLVGWTAGVVGMMASGCLVCPPGWWPADTSCGTVTAAASTTAQPAAVISACRRLRFFARPWIRCSEPVLG